VVNVAQHNQYGRRSRGKRAGIDSESIVEAARTLDPSSITMQAVADRLGVTRKALHHHVSDRDGLIEMVAADRFARLFSNTDLKAGTSWQGSCALFADAMVKSLLATGELTAHLRFGRSTNLFAMPPTAVAFDCLIAAGFDEPTAAQGLAALASLCTGYAQNRVNAEPNRTTREGLGVSRPLGATPAEEGSPLPRAMRAGHGTAHEDQQRLNVQLWTLGMERLLGLQKARTPTGSSTVRRH
jgi:AcrR family transcriptional regulator